MTWCARCDELTIGRAGDACPSCGEPIIETTKGARRSRSGTQLLELEAPPAVLVEEPPTILPAPPGRSRREQLSAILSRRTRLIAGGLVLAIAGATYVGLASDPASRPAPNASTTPTTESTTSKPLAPPLGTGVSGWVVFPSQHGFTTLDLSNGWHQETKLGTDVYMLTVSPVGRRIAFLDGFRMLHVTDANGDNAASIASEVDAFSWTQNGETLMVSRSQADGRGRPRTRIEMISVEDRGSLLLAETRHNVGTVVSRSGRHMVTVYDDEGPSIYEVAPRTFRLVSRDATLLDLSPDGTHALISFYRDARLRMLDMETGETRRVGPKRFLSSAARFSPDGRRVALTGTPNVFVETECEEAQSPCEPFFTANDVILWTLDPSTLKMRSILAAGSNGMSAPVWGPEGWLLIQSGSRSIAVPIDEPSRATVRFEGDFTQDWLEAQYLA